MAVNGNPEQWGTRHPPRALLEEDIPAGRLYVCEDGTGIYGVFAFIIGEDPTYLKIDDGKWLSDTPYGVIHRIAGKEAGHGVLGEAVGFCTERIPHLRIDTHEDNSVMRHLLPKHGFVSCGTIYIADGSPRIAYERI